MSEELVYGMSTETKRQSITVFNLSWEGEQFQSLDALGMSTSARGDAELTDLGLQIHFSK